MAEAQTNGTSTNGAAPPPAAAATTPDPKVDADRAQLIREAAAGRQAASERDALRKQLAEIEGRTAKETETRTQREQRLAALKESDPRAWLREVSGHEATEIAQLLRKRAGVQATQGKGSAEVAALTREIESLKAGLAERDAKATERETAQAAAQRQADEANVHAHVTRFVAASKEFPHFKAAMETEGNEAYWRQALYAYCIKNPKADERAVSAAFEKHFLTRDEKRASLLGYKRASSKETPPATATERAKDGQSGTGPRTLTNGLSAERAPNDRPPPRNQRERADDREERIRRAIAIASRG